MSKLDAERQGLIDILEQRTVLLEKSIESLKKSLAATEGIERIDSKVIASFQESLKDAKAEIAKQTAKANFWRRFAGLGVTAALTIGLIVGFVVGNK